MSVCGKMQIVKAVFHNNLTFHSTCPLPTKARISASIIHNIKGLWWTRDSGSTIGRDLPTASWAFAGGLHSSVLKTVEGCDSQSGHSIRINTPIWHRNEELYDPIIWKACYGSQCPSAEREQKASLMPVFICCLSAFQHPQIHGQPHFCRMWNPRAIPCGAAVRAFLYNQIKMRLSFKCFGLTFSPLSFIFVSECAFLLKKKPNTTKKFLSSLEPCSDALWTTSGLQTTGWVMVHKSTLHVKSSAPAPSAKVTLFTLACSPMLCQTQFCVIWVTKLPSRLWGKLFHCLPGLSGQNVDSWSPRCVFSRRALWN